jgi:hypothetical protein
VITHQNQYLLYPAGLTFVLLPFEIIVAGINEFLPKLQSWLIPCGMAKHAPTSPGSKKKQLTDGGWAMTLIVMYCVLLRIYDRRSHLGLGARKIVQKFLTIFEILH